MEKYLNGAPSRASVRRMLAAEGLGTFLLVAGGCTAAAWDAGHGRIGTPGVAFVFGAIVAAMVWFVGPVSGAHLNPVVTAAFLVRQDIPPGRALAFVGVQSMAAVAGAGIVFALLPTGGPATVTHPLPDLGLAAAFLLEVGVTALLVFVILLVATAPSVRRWLRACAIGGAVFVGAWVAGPFTGGSMNPARSLGPALVAGDVTHLWLYFLAPAAGALAGLLLHAALVRWHRATTRGPVEVTP